jgi:hypothetical protein
MGATETVLILGLTVIQKAEKTPLTTLFGLFVLVGCKDLSHFSSPSQTRGGWSFRSSEAMSDFDGSIAAFVSCDCGFLME